MTVTRHATTFIGAKWFHPGRVRPVRLIVVHDTESSETTGAARAVANDFRTRPASNKGSSHTVTDRDETVGCVQEEDTAFAAPGANADGLQLELIGRAGQGTAGWADPYSAGVLERGALVVADWCARHAIPPVRLTVPELKDPTRRGIIGHIDATQAFPPNNGHSDPGPTFPWPTFLARVVAILGSGGAVGTAPVSGTVLLLPDGRIVEVTSVEARHVGTPAEVVALLGAGGGPQTTATRALAGRVRVT